jgi:hypothetical protein
MKSKILFAGLLAVALLASGCAGQGSQTASERRANSSLPVAQAGDAHAGHAAPGRVPAFETDPASLKKLPPTLDPKLFTGQQREGYAAVREIPQTIAQLPCYCHCDEGFGHKSLHTCYVDDHAAHCGICIDEALLAYKLHKQDKLTPAQIRERIIAEYTNH